MSISELVAAVGAAGIPLGEAPNQTIADAIRWEVRRGRVSGAGRGRYKMGRRLPASTLHYMRVRVDLYAADPSLSYALPSYLPRLPGDGPPTSAPPGVSAPDASAPDASALDVSAHGESALDLSEAD